jgi:hypothetical protein
MFATQLYCNKQKCIHAQLAACTSMLINFIALKLRAQELEAARRAAEAQEREAKYVAQAAYWAQQEAAQRAAVRRAADERVDYTVSNMCMHAKLLINVVIAFSFVCQLSISNHHMISCHTTCIF